MGDTLRTAMEVEVDDMTLLELAANAIGVRIAQGSRIAIDGKLWNPLNDDGDALRLAVKLRLVLFLELPRIGIGPMIDGPEVYVEDGEDELAATRRAIVRAAAAIGQGIAQPAARPDLPEDNYYKTQAEAEELGRAAAALAEQRTGGRE